MDQGLSPRGYSAVVLSWVLTCFAIVSVGLRFISAGFFRKRMQWDDGLVIVALGLNIFYAVCVQLCYVNGLGYHGTDLMATPTRLTTCLKWIQLSIVPGTLSAMSARICFAAYLLFIIGKSSRWQRISMIVLIVTQLLINIPLALLTLLQCGRQISAIWGASVAKCLRSTHIFYYAYAVSGVNVTTDLYLSALPAYIVWKLQMPLRRRLTLIALLGSTVFFAAANLSKTIVIHKLSKDTDYTYDAIELLVWITVEGSLILILGCAPTWIALFWPRRVPRPSTNGSHDENSLKLVGRDMAGENHVSCTHGPGTPRTGTPRGRATGGISMTKTFKSTSEECMLRSSL